MIQPILQQDMPQAYNLGRANVGVVISSLVGRISFKDITRCANCKTKLTQPCNEENMLVSTGTATVMIVDHEEYIKQFAGTQLGKGKKCDYLMVDDSGANYKIAFCDLTCSKEVNVEPDTEREYLPEGKRAKVMLQLEESVKRFTDKATTKAYIQGFNKRHCLFGWRDPFVSDTLVVPTRNDVEANMMVFGRTASNVEPQLLHHKTIDGIEFVFYQIKYPTVYNW